MTNTLPIRRGGRTVLFAVCVALGLCAGGAAPRNKRPPPPDRSIRN